MDGTNKADTLPKEKRPTRKEHNLPYLLWPEIKARVKQKKNFVSFSPWHLTKVQKLLNFSRPTETNVLNSPIPNIRKVAPVQIETLKLRMNSCNI